jgi:hypothetical protein
MSVRPVNGIGGWVPDSADCPDPAMANRLESSRLAFDDSSLVHEGTRHFVCDDRVLWM